RKAGKNFSIRLDRQVGRSIESSCWFSSWCLLRDFLQYEQRILLRLARLELRRARGDLSAPRPGDDTERQFVAFELINALGRRWATHFDVHGLGLLRGVHLIFVHFYPGVIIVRA